MFSRSWAAHHYIQARIFKNRMTSCLPIILVVCVVVFTEIEYPNHQCISHTPIFALVDLGVPPHTPLQLPIQSPTGIASESRFSPVDRATNSC